MGIRNRRGRRNLKILEPDRFGLKQPSYEPIEMEIASTLPSGRQVRIDVRLWQHQKQITFFVFNFNVQQADGAFANVARIDSAHGSIHAHILKPDGANLDPLMELYPYTETNWRKTLETHYDNLYTEYVLDPSFVIKAYERWHSHGWL